MFVGGIIYTLRNIGRSTSYSDIDSHYKEKRLRRWFIKNGVEPDRLSFLKEELTRIENDIKATEAHRYS